MKRRQKLRKLILHAHACNFLYLLYIFYICRSHVTPTASHTRYGAAPIPTARLPRLYTWSVPSGVRALPDHTTSPAVRTSSHRVHGVPTWEWRVLPTDGVWCRTGTTTGELKLFFKPFQIFIEISVQLARIFKMILSFWNVRRSMFLSKPNSAQFNGIDNLYFWN